ncbi:MAG: hypothetical protein OEX12_14640, partial [Gammaproteobacteria bacterium]|nr:hypothetical protein [Gammaproteobacteria bacterium]
YNREIDAPVVLRDVTRELGVLQGMYKDFAALQMDLGVIKRVPKRHAIEGIIDIDSEERRMVQASKKEQAQIDQVLNDIDTILRSEMGISSGDDIEIH